MNFKVLKAKEKMLRVKTANKISLNCYRRNSTQSLEHKDAKIC